MIDTSPQTLCYHCGLECEEETFQTEEKSFCCSGCQTVYQILKENNLCQYYDLEKMAGNTPKVGHFVFLENPSIANTLLDFKNDILSKVTLFVPKIHCSSCLYLLENLYRIHPGIERSKVDFLKKRVSVTYKNQDLNLRSLADLLTSIGYEPLITQKDDSVEKQKNVEKRFLTELGVAGFCAGNVMLFSFPEYLGLQEATYKILFGYLNISLSIPVVFYSGSGYFESVYKSLKNKIINIDFPILLSILVAFFAGIYQVVFKNGAGYFDSLTGLIFFLLIGKWFQQKTYTFLSFERDYKSYLPLAVTRLIFGKEEAVAIQELKKGDKVIVRNGELIPADAMLYEGVAHVDYSFVTGEAALEDKNLGDILYAGGRQIGGSLKLEVIKAVSHSYLTQLWNNDTFQKEQTSKIQPFSNLVGKYFTFGVLSLAFSVALYWYFNDSSKTLNTFISVLIIACPCTLSLSYPFALGNGLRIFSKRNFYLKNSGVIEQMAHCDTLVFDKTGTLTKSNTTPPVFIGKNPLSEFEKQIVASLVSNSSHPISVKIRAFLNQNILLPIDGFKEVPGNGILGECESLEIKLGSREWISKTKNEEIKMQESASVAYLAINEQYIGYFLITNPYRDDIKETLLDLSKRYEMHLVSGDNDSERKSLEPFFADNQNLYFNCSPQDKLTYIKNLQESGKKVIMLGDGLNDAGALKQADVGIAVTEDTLNFTPMSDAILQADQLKSMPQFLKYSQFAMRLIRFSYAFSLLYNFVGLSFAVQGNLSPIIAAILMPLNSITLVGIASLGMIWGGKKIT